MPRDFDSLYKSQVQTRTTMVKNETLMLPPGYLVGFNVLLRKDYTVLIKAGACNIGGILVQMKEDHQLAEADWVAPKINSTRHYYIYLSKAGQWFVDIVAPVWNNQYLYYEQPDTKWRTIGKMFLADNNIIFAIKEVEKNEQTVTVAPEGYTGKADYYCPGDNDQILINAAIQYLHEAYNGGEVNFLRGNYYLAGSIIIPYDSITLRSENEAKIIKNCDAYAISIYGTGSTHIINNALIGLNIYRDTSDTNANYTIHCLAADYLLITNCYIENAYDTAIYLEDCKAHTIRDNKISGFGKDGRNGVAGIYGWGSVGSGYISGNYVSGNLSTVTAATIYGISDSGASAFDGGTIIEGNNVYNIRNENASGVITGIYTNGSVIHANDNIIRRFISYGNIYGLDGNSTYTKWSNNNLESLAASVTSIGIYSRLGNGANISHNNVQTSSDYGIVIASGYSYNSVNNNYCYYNGSDTGIANTNQNNFLDSGTDTQIYSNSWQQPVTNEDTRSELHFKYQATATTSGYILSGATVSAVWSSVSLGALVPVGTKAIYATAGIKASCSGAGMMSYYLAFSDDSSATPAYGTRHPMIAWTVYDGSGSSYFRQDQLITIPINSSRKFYYYAVTRTNTTNCLVYMSLKGYYV